MSKENEKFAAPEAELSETDRLAALRAKAALQAAAEFNEDELFARMLAEERSKRLERLTNGPEVELATDTRGFPEDYDVIKIFRGPNKQDLNYVPLSLDGLVIKVPRDVEVILPHAFIVDCLDQCVETNLIPMIDARGNRAGVELRPAHRFPYNFVRKATTEEYKKFQAEQIEKARRELAQAA